MAAFTALFKNTRTLKFKGQLTFAYFAAVNHLSGPLRKQWSVIGGFRLACVQTPLPSGKIGEGVPSQAARVCKKRSKLPQKFCYHGNVATHFFFLNSAINSPPPGTLLFSSNLHQYKSKNFSRPEIFQPLPTFADFFFIPRTSRCTYLLLPTWIRSVLALLFRARRTS